MEKEKINNSSGYDREPGSFPEKLKKENPFLVPDSYFESLPGRISDRVRSHPDISVPVIPVYRRNVFRVSIAAAISVALIISAFFLFFLNKEQKIITSDNYSLTIEDLDSLNFIQNLDEYTLISYYLEQTDQTIISPVKTDEKPDGRMPVNNTDTNVSNTDIKQYLLESNEIEQMLYDL